MSRRTQRDSRYAGFIGTAAHSQRAGVARPRHQGEPFGQACLRGSRRENMPRDLVGGGNGHKPYRVNPREVQQFRRPGTAGKIHHQRRRCLVRLGYEHTGQAPQDVILDLKQVAHPAHQGGLMPHQPAQFGQHRDGRGGTAGKVGQARTEGCHKFGQFRPAALIQPDHCRTQDRTGAVEQDNAVQLPRQAKGGNPVGRNLRKDVAADGQKGGPPILRVLLGPVVSRLEGAVRLMRTSLCFPYPTCRSGSETAAPLGESGGAGLLVGDAVLEVALRRKVVVDRGMD